MKKLLTPIHPGEILYEEFMKPMDISINRLARKLSVPPDRVSETVNGRCGITADTAVRLGKFFNLSPRHAWDFRLNTTCVLPAAPSQPKSGSVCMHTRFDKDI